jgi:hypothetical protein
VNTAGHACFVENLELLAAEVAAEERLGARQLYRGGADRA